MSETDHARKAIEDTTRDWIEHQKKRGAYVNEEQARREHAAMLEKAERKKKRG